MEKEEEAKDEDSRRWQKFCFKKFLTFPRVQAAKKETARKENTYAEKDTRGGNGECKFLFN